MNLLSYSVGPKEPVLKELTMGAALAKAATSHPDKVALVAGVANAADRRQWTYAELYNEASQVAKALLQHFQPGEHLAVWGSNIPEWVLLEYGCALAGIVLVTVNPSNQANELAYILKQSDSVGIFLMSEVRGNNLYKHLDSVKGDCEKLREVFRFEDWDSFMANADKDVQLPEVKPDDCCMIQYTSGTTGFPKGVLLTHMGLVNNAAQLADRQGSLDEGVSIGFMPLFHTGGCGGVVLSALSKRSTLVLMEQFDPGLALELIETYKVDSIVGVPTMYLALLEHPDFDKRDLSSTKALVAGGAAVPVFMVEKIEKSLDADFSIIFGQTETSPVSCMVWPNDDPEDKATTLGQALPHLEVKIVDPETGEKQPYNEVGEYCVRGYSLMKGYYKNPEATAATIDKDGWLHTGDLCSMDERGYCTVQGRIKEMIIRGGENLFPREIEDVLFKHPDVAEIAVVGVPDDRMGEEVAAFIRPASAEGIVDKDKLKTYVREHLSPQKTPRHWFQVSEFPLTGSGKIQKFVLRDQYADGCFQEL